MDHLIVPTKIFSGADSLSVLDSIQNCRILLVCDAFLPKSDSLKDIQSHLASSNSVTLFSDVKPDPPLDNIWRGYQFLQPLSRLL